MQDEFYSVAFRKKLYRSLEELQADLDQWTNDYNQNRPHSGKYCFGKTPMQTFRDSKYLAVTPSSNRSTLFGLFSPLRWGWHSSFTASFTKHLIRPHPSHSIATPYRPKPTKVGLPPARRKVSDR